MMKQMRENTKVILWVVVIAFVVTIFAVWGLDLQTGGISGGQNQGLVGRVNGVPITPQAFQAAYNQFATQYRNNSPSGNLSYSDQEMLRDQTWQSLVNNILTDEIIKDYGITVTDQEVLAFLRTSPPPEIQQYFLDDQGQFDFAAYQAALNNPDADWTAVEALARQRIPLLKLNTYLTSQVHVGAWETRMEWEAENTDMVVEYVAFPIADEDVSNYEPTDAEIREYYDNNPDEFAEDARAQIDYVRVPIAATPADHEEVRLTLENIREDIVAGDDFASNASTFSDGFTAAVGGETGFITRAQRPPAVFDALDKLQPNEISQPIDTPDGYYLVQLLEKKKEDGEERYNMREILLNVTAGALTVDSLIATAQDIQKIASEGGTLESAGEKYGLTVQTTEPFVEGGTIPGLGYVPSVARFAFANDAGTLSNVLQDDENYYIVRVAERIPAGTQAFDEVKEEIGRTLVSDHQKALARHKAEGFHRKLMTSGVTFDQAAEQYAYTVVKTDTFTTARAGAGLRPRSPFTLAALELQQDQISAPVESMGDYVVMHMIYREPFDNEAFAAQASQIRSQLQQKKVSDFIAYWYEQLQENSDIEDYRGTL